MFRAVVVEDEERILNNICRRIEKISPRFHVVAQFTNPLQALEYLQVHRVDVVFTDIRMPGIDGLTLLESLGNKSLLTVIISSYQDFSYAKNAIRLHVSEYLLKPFLDDELSALLLRLTEQLNMLCADKLTDELIPFLKSGLRSDTLEQLCTQMGCFSMAALSSGMESGFGKDSRDGLYNAAAPVYSQEKILLPFFANNNSLLIYFCAAKDSENLARQLAEEWFGRGGTAVYSGCFQELSDMPELYERLCSGFAMAVFPGKPSLCALDTLVAPQKDFSELQEDYQRLALIVKSASRESIMSGLKVIMQRFEELSLSQYDLRQQITVLFIKLYTELYRQFPDFRHLDRIQRDILDNCRSYDDIAAGLLDEIIHHLCNNDKCTKEVKTELVNAIRRYLDENVTKPIGLTDIAEHFGFSQTYIIRVFREAFGTSPIEYLITSKISKSKEQLRFCPEKQVREIAEQLGYSNQYYFSRAFKQAVGVSPTEYRKSC